jgi:solute carrier family 9 (sodium/hydrogen exchanger), member 6/7
MTFIFHGISIFLVSSRLSVALDVSFGLGMSLLLKHTLNPYPSCVVTLVAYT